VNSSRLSQVEEQNYEVEIKKATFFVNSSPEVIVLLVQKALLIRKIKQKITLGALQNLWQRAKIRPE